MRFVSLLALIAALLLASCGGGGGGQSASEYRSDLNSACRQLSADTGRIGQAIRQGMDVNQARALAAQAGGRFTSQVHDLDPPDSLKDAHQELLDVGDEASKSTATASVANVRALAQRLLVIYTKLGAAECVRLEQQALQRNPAE